VSLTRVGGEYRPGVSAQQTGFLRFDGHRIAFATVGSGAPVVLPAWWVSNVVEDWKIPAYSRFMQGLAAGKQAIRYDRLGCGMSDRKRPRKTMTLENELAMLDAVVDHLGLERFSLFGGSFAGCTAVVYAARHGERVDRLVLYGSFANGAELAHPPAREALIELVRKHWGLGSRMLADTFAPSGSAAERASFASFQRNSASPEMAADLLELTFATDVRETLAGVRVPTLIVHRRGDRAIRLGAGEQLAALIPNADLVVLEGDAHLPWQGDLDDVLVAVAPFLGVTPPARETRAEVEELTPREREVLRLVAEGLSDGDIAAQLVLSPHTVHRHVANILRKLGLHSRAAAAAHAARAGLV
jgi:pimeloyl-ACP methyl ester carboxylesterase/DNA-binding CsgD family transcriptional regulator